jgi:hypothetical protein
MRAILLVCWGEKYLCLAQKGAWCLRWVAVLQHEWVALALTCLQTSW